MDYFILHIYLPYSLCIINNVCIINIQVPHEVKHQRALARKTPNN